MDAHAPAPMDTLAAMRRRRRLGARAAAGASSWTRRIGVEEAVRCRRLLAFVFVLGVLVFVHELGHFLVARWHGVRVLTFSLGFGPKLCQCTRGDTEYA